MLYRLLDTVCQRIDRLDVKAEIPQMLEQIKRARPDLRQHLAQTKGTPAVRDLVAQAIAAGVLQQIKELPRIAAFLAEKSKSGRIAPSVRCGVASVLAYLVQPRDLIPDDAPGGYGFIDDSAILRAGLVTYLRVSPAPQFDIDEQEKYINMTAGVVPPQTLPLLQLTVGNMATAFQVMSMLPPAVATLTLQQLVANPLNVGAPQGPPGFTPAAVPTYGSGHWSGGGYFEGGNVVIPGGPSLIDGKLFIPD